MKGFLLPADLGFRCLLGGFWRDGKKQTQRHGHYRNRPLALGCRLPQQTRRLERNRLRSMAFMNGNRGALIREINSAEWQARGFRRVDSVPFLFDRRDTLRWRRCLFRAVWCLRERIPTSRLHLNIKKQQLKTCSQDHRPSHSIKLSILMGAFSL